MSDKHSVVKWRDQGWCEKCKVDANRPVLEIITAVTQRVSEYRYMCDRCASEWLGRLAIPGLSQRDQERAKKSRDRRKEMVAP